MINGIILMVIYGIVSMFSCLLIKRNYIKYTYKIKAGYDNAVKLKIHIIIVISFLFTLVNWFATDFLSHSVLGSDRLNYSIEFLGSRSVQSIGVQFIFDIVKKCGGNIYTVFYITTFITVFITLIAYRKSKLASPKIIILLFASEYIFFTFTGIKQSYAVAFSFLFFVNAVENKKKNRTILCVIYILLSIAFHSAGYILLPLLFIHKLNDKKRCYILVVALVACLGFLPNIMQFIGDKLGFILPVLASKINTYFGNSTVGLDSKWSAILKYFPFFYVSLWGILNRKRFKEVIYNYDELLVITITGSLIVLYSIYSYWFQRFRYSFYFPIFLLYDLMDRNENLNGNKIINNTAVIGGTLLITFRKIVLIFSNYGMF